MGPETLALLIPLAGILSIFVFLPLILFHYITLWRRQKTLQPDDERMLEDLWRSAKAMERRIETLESLLEAREAEIRRPPRTSRPTLDD